MNSIKGQPEKQVPPIVARVVASLPFFGLALWFGGVATQVLWQRYGSHFLGSFGFVLNFGLFRLREPWSSSVVLVCCACLVWGGCSVLRTGRGLRGCGCSNTLLLCVHRVLSSRGVVMRRKSSEVGGGNLEGAAPFPVRQPRERRGSPLSLAMGSTG
jgi:hypothetical protein